MKSHLKIVVDENIAFAEEAFSPFGNVTRMQGRLITKDIVKDADVLIVRSVTKVNESLLAGSRVRFIGTATIGTDHIDERYCKHEGIQCESAKGSNADSVCEYVFTALLHEVFRTGKKLSGMRIGIVGVGNIGSRIARTAEALGLQVLKNDPPLQRTSQTNNFLPLHKLFDADAITIHTPLTVSGEDKTLFLFNKENLPKIKNGAILINSARGEVIRNGALREIIEAKAFEAVLDVWENEPDVDPDLLNKTRIATPHIAGYSFEGKVNGTKMMHDALARFLKKQPVWTPVMPEVKNDSITISGNLSVEEIINRAILHAYPITEDDTKFRKMLTLPAEKRSHHFDDMRKRYAYRREFSNFTVILSPGNTEAEGKLRALRFTVR